MTSEREVITDRLNVAKVMLSYEESSKRPNLFKKNNEGHTAYALMLLRQFYLTNNSQTR